MSFCRNCGAKIIGGAKFCQKCGCAVSTQPKENGNQRQAEAAGKLYKCPSCGEVLKSFETICPACGLELRGTKATSAVREFALKLEAIEANREYEKMSFFKKQAYRDEISKTDAQKISLIQSFSVPNTKEDMLEFMILAITNINTSTFGTTGENKGEKAMANAWFSKVKQVYMKACHSYGSEKEFSRIKNLYVECEQEIRKQKRKGGLKFALLIGWLPVLLIIEVSWMIHIAKDSNLEKVDRLNNVVLQIQEALENEEYKLALMHAESIEFEDLNSEQERQWKINREYWIEEVISEAAAHGVYLERSTPEETDDINQENETIGSNSGFIKGFMEGLRIYSDE